MTRSEIIQRLKKYFSVKELVCPHAYKTFGEKSWMFLSTEILHTLLVLRTDILDVPLVCNNWHIGGTLSQRGLRCNLCDLVKSKTYDESLYLSAHINGCGLDLSSSRMDAEEMRTRIAKNWKRLPYPVRIESDVTWLHIDTYDDGSGPISYFK